MLQTIQEVLLGGQVQHEHFAAFIKAFKIPDPQDAVTLMLLENLPHYVVKPEQRQDLLLFSQFHTDVDFMAYTSGRIFHEQGELRWEKRQDHMQVVYTGHERYKPDLPGSEMMILDAEPEPDSYLLFGQRLDDTQLARIGSSARPGDFAEVRIHRLLRYPYLDELKDVKHVQLLVCEYKDRATGSNIAYRFKKLAPFKMKKSQEQEN